MKKAKAVLSLDSLKEMLGLASSDVVRNISLNHDNDQIEIDLSSEESLYKQEFSSDSVVPKLRIGVERVMETDSFRLTKLRG